MVVHIVMYDKLHRVNLQQQTLLRIQALGLFRSDPEEGVVEQSGVLLDEGRPFRVGLARSVHVLVEEVLPVPARAWDL